MHSDALVVVRGAGDLATGVIQKFVRSGLRVLALEVPAPTAIRRTVSLCEAVYEGSAQVEDIRCRRIKQPGEMHACHLEGVVPLLVDPEGACIRSIAPACVVDAILAKRNLGTTRAMAPCTIALGPGFVAGRDVDIVVETMRGPNLGRLVFEGAALPNTGTPGEVAGESSRRVLHAPAAGNMRHEKSIGDAVQAGEVLFCIGKVPVQSPFAGVLRGLLRQGLPVFKGMKVADVDPRPEVDVCAISDKARCVGGGALEAYFYLRNH